MHKEIKSILNLGIAIYCLVQNILFFHLLHKNINCNKTINLSVSCGCETWYVTLDEEHRLRRFENKVLW